MLKNIQINSIKYDRKKIKNEYLERFEQIYPIPFKCTKDKGDLLEYYVCAKYGGVRFDDITKELKNKLELSYIDKGIDIIDFDRCLFIQCKHYDSRLSFADISTFEYYSNYLNELKFFSGKYKKVLAFAGTGKIDPLIEKYKNISINKIIINEEKKSYILKAKKNKNLYLYICIFLLNLIYISIIILILFFNKI